MSYEEFRRHIGKAGLQMKDFASLINMTPTALSAYSKKGEVPTHLAIIAVLLGELADNQIDYKQALSKVTLSPKKPRGISLKKATAANDV
jgi:23S rRNA maturation-related 3'-5' exoribonuclease YhaM